MTWRASTLSISPYQHGDLEQELEDKREEEEGVEDVDGVLELLVGRRQRLVEERPVLAQAAGSFRTITRPMLERERTSTRPTLNFLLLLLLLPSV